MSAVWRMQIKLGDNLPTYLPSRDPIEADDGDADEPFDGRLRLNVPVERSSATPSGRPHWSARGHTTAFQADELHVAFAVLGPTIGQRQSTRRRTMHKSGNCRFIGGAMKEQRTCTSADERSLAQVT